MASLPYLLLGAVAAGLLGWIDWRRQLRRRQAQTLRRAVLRLEAEEVAHYRRSDAMMPETEIRKVRSVA